MDDQNIISNINPEEDLSNNTPGKKYLVTAELVNEWKKSYLGAKHSLSSTITYYNYLKLFSNFCFDQPISQTLVDKFVEKHKSPVASAALKNFFNFIVRKKKFPMEILNIYFDKKKSEKKIPETFSPAEVEKIIECMGKEISLKDKYFTIVLASLGLRISEGLNLAYSDFKWLEWLQDRSKYGSVTLRKTKGGKDRILTVSPEIMELIYSVSNKSSEGIPIEGHIFDYGYYDYCLSKESKKHSDAENLYRYIKYASDRYRDSLDRVTKICLSGKKAHPHMFRSFRAQYLLDKGLPIEYLKAYLGHSSLVTTEIYAKANPTILSKKIEEVEKNANNN